MQRRSFLSLATSTVVASALGQSPANSASKPAPPKQSNAQPIPPVLANTDRTGELHTMGYSSMAFKVLTQDSHGDLFMIEHHMHQRGGPPLHVHPHQDETFYVLEGEFVAEVGGKRFNLHPGDSVLAPRNIPHVWACVGNGTGKMIIAFTPAGKMETFFDKVSATHALLQDAALFRDHDMELLGPPLKV
jgi:quercetin dioxygenase-like cupin family protein